MTVFLKAVLRLSVAEEMVTGKGGESREFSACLLGYFWFEVRAASGTSGQVPKPVFCGFTITLSKMFSPSRCCAEDPPK